MRKKVTTYAFIDASNIIYGARSYGWLFYWKGTKKGEDSELESFPNLMTYF